MFIQHTKAMAHTPVLLPGKSHGWRSLVGCRPWGRCESDTTERLHFTIQPAGFPDGASDKELTCQCRRHKRRGFHPWVKKTPWRRAWQTTPVFLLGESHDRGTWWATVHGVTKTWTRLKWFSIAYNIPLSLTSPCFSFPEQLITLSVFLTHNFHD